MVKSKYGAIREKAQQQVDTAGSRLQGAKQHIEHCQQMLQKAWERENGASEGTSRRHYRSAAKIETEILDWE